MSSIDPRRSGALAILAAAALAAPAAAGAATLSVPSQYPTIQAAIDAARNGDVVEVAAGQYVERITFPERGPGITVQGAGADVTTIDGGGAGTTVTFLSTSTIRGFTITGGRSSSYGDGGGGVLVGTMTTPGGSPTIEDCVVEGNFAPSGAGISVENGSATIRRNVIRDNVEACGSGCSGGGIVVSSGATVVSQNLIERNTSERGAGIAVEGGNVLVERNVIRDNLGDPINGGTQGGEGLYVGTFATAKIVGNLFEGNERGGVVVNTLFASDTALVVNNTIVANGTSSAPALVVRMDGSTSKVEVVNNVLTGAGPTVSCFGSYPSAVVFRTNLVYASDGNHASGCALSGGSSAGNVSVDPLLVDPAYGNFRLRTSSPAVNAGTATMPTGVTLPSVDLDGLARVLGGAVDLGAYEYQGLTAVTAPASADFGRQRVGTTGPAQTITFTNSGAVPLNVTDVSVSGEYAFTSDCRGPDGIAPGQSCTATVTFHPLARFARPGALVLRGNLGQVNGAPASPAGEIAATVPLAGTGIAPHVVLSRDAIAFGTQRVATGSAPQAFVLTNDGEVPLTLSAFGADGPYQLTLTGCVTVAPDGGTCAVEITFWPTARGDFPATFTVESDAINSPNTVALTGRGVAPVVSLSPPSLDLGDLRLGESAAARTSTLTNVGDAPLAISSVAATGTGFSGSSDCPATLAPAASCTLRAAFASSAAGTASGTLAVSDDALNGPTRVGLTARVHDLMVVVSPSDETAPRGGTATYSLVVSRAGSFDPFDYPVTLSCSGAPSGCSFSPSATVTPGYQATVTMSVPIPVSASAPGGTASLGLVLLPVSALALGSRRRRGALLALALAALAGATACGGSNGLAPPGPASYTITVTATSGSLVRTDTATLHVR